MAVTSRLLQAIDAACAPERPPERTVLHHPGLADADRDLIRAIQEGLPLVSRPYAAVAAQIGMTEDEVILRLQRLLQQGMIKRLGVVVRHHELGYRANAMVVWDVPDEQVTGLGERFGEFPFITLCYRRPRRPPQWPYNLFCMIHGQDRETVRGHVRTLIAACGLEFIRHDLLFSARRFKQCGAHYMAPAEGRAGTEGHSQPRRHAERI